MKIFNFQFLLLLLLSTPALAQFQIDADIRPRFEYRHGFGSLFPDNADAAAFVTQRTRLNFGYSMERLDMMISVQDVSTWGDTMLAWDVIVLNEYLFINITIPLYILFRHYQGKEAKRSVYIPGSILSVLWAVGIHLVTAFLYEGLQARPFWNNALLGPRFLASAFAAGPALIILVLAIIRRFTEFNIEQKTINKIAMIVVVAAQINLIMLASELFKEFYAPTHHSESAYYLFFGLEGKTALLPWIWTAIPLSILATVLLTFHKLRRNPKVLYICCFLLFVAIWIEKGFGLIVPGFIPGPYGTIAEYTPTGIEIGVTLGIWAMGAFIFTMLAKTSIGIELGKLRYRKKEHKKAITSKTA